VAGEGVVETPTHVVRVKVGESPGGVRAATRRARAARKGGRAPGQSAGGASRGSSRRRR
jgi:16S rRNA (guanine527-N7)-methyltransferase